MCQYDYELPSFVCDTWPKARKPHKCGECYRTIEPGEHYRRTTGKWDGEMSTNLMCQHCDEGRKLLLKECRAFLYGGIEEDLSEHARARLPWSMKAARMTVGMRRKWRRFTSAGLMPVIKFEKAHA